MQLTVLLAILAALGAAAWVAIVVLPSEGQAPPRPLGWLILLVWGGVAVACVGVGLLVGGLGFVLALVGVGLAGGLGLLRARVVEMTGGASRRWAIARAWEALAPIRAEPRPNPGDAAWARVILHELDRYRGRDTDEFIGLLQSHLRGKLEGEQSVDPEWATARLDELAAKLFGGAPTIMVRPPAPRRSRGSRAPTSRKRTP